MAVVTFIVKSEQSKAREGKNNHQINSHNDGAVLDVYPYFINDKQKKTCPRNCTSVLTNYIESTGNFHLTI